MFLEVNVSDLNWLAVVAAAVIPMVVGYIWYHPSVFGTMWMKLEGLSEKDINSGAAGKAMGLTFVASIVQAFFLALAVQFTGAVEAMDGLKLGFFIWLGFVTTTTVADSLFGQKPTNLYVIQTSYRLVVLLINAMVLTLWV